MCYCYVLLLRMSIIVTTTITSIIIHQHRRRLLRNVFSEHQTSRVWGSLPDDQIIRGIRISGKPHIGSSET